MSAVLTPPEIPTATEKVAEERFVLCDVNWETYEQLLKNYQNQSSPRFAYDNGVLEIFMPSQEHEESNCFFELFTSAIAEERKLKIRSLGSTTQKREDLLKGIEPDSCFYIQSASLIANVKKVDLSIHPPPDLAIEVDVTSSSLDRFAIYAALRVPEIWRCEGDEVKFFRLEENKYIETFDSIILSNVTPTDVTRFLHESQTLERYEWLSNVREWVRSL